VLSRVLHRTPAFLRACNVTHRSATSRERRPRSRCDPWPLP